LLGKKVEEIATLPNGESEIVSIEPAPIDKPVEAISAAETVQV